jgi:hypothetical protein
LNKILFLTTQKKPSTPTRLPKLNIYKSCQPLHI